MKSVFIVAVATDDGEVITEKHFGDALEFLLYAFEVGRFYFDAGADVRRRKIGAVQNEAAELDEEHGSEEKARKIIELLRKQNVDVMLALRIGPNILKVKKFFLPVVVGAEHRKIQDALALVAENAEKIFKALVERNPGEEFQPLFLK